MNKRGLLILSILTLCMNFVSAYGYGLGDLLDNIGTENIVLVASFIISFAFIFYVLGKFFKGNTAIPGVIALASAFLITQGVNKFDLGFKARIYFNLSDDLFNTIIGLIAIIAFIALIIFFIARWIKKGKYSYKPKKLPVFKIILLLTGVVLFILGFFVNKPMIPIGTGIVLIILALYLIFRKKGGDDSKKPTKVVYVDWYPQKGLFVHKKGLIGRTVSHTKEGIESELRNVYPEYNIIIQFRQKEPTRPFPGEKDKRRQERSERVYVQQQAQQAQRMQRKRSLNELKRYRNYLKFKRNQNIPKAKGESSESYQIRNKNRKKKIDKMVQELDRRIREMS